MFIDCCSFSFLPENLLWRMVHLTRHNCCIWHNRSRLSMGDGHGPGPGQGKCSGMWKMARGEEHKDILQVDSPDPNPLHKALWKRVLPGDLLNVWEKFLLWTYRLLSQVHVSLGVKPYSKSPLHSLELEGLLSTSLLQTQSSSHKVFQGVEHSEFHFQWNIPDPKVLF